MKKETKVIMKIEKVIKSCTTEEHIKATRRLLDNYENMFEPKNALTEQWHTFVVSRRNLGNLLMDKRLEIRDIHNGTF